jgi:DNA-binding NtrC family response regulator
LRERRESELGSAKGTTGAFDPMTGAASALAVALVIGKSAGERESVARAMHRDQRGPDGPFHRIQCGTDEGLLRQALQSWLAGSSRNDSPQFLTRLESGSLFLDGVEALGVETQSLLLDFMNRSSGVADEAEGASDGPSQPWNGQLIAGSEFELRRAVRDRGFLSGLAERLEKVRIVLDPDDVDSRES